MAKRMNTKYGRRIKLALFAFTMIPFCLFFIFFTVSIYNEKMNSEIAYYEKQLQQQMQAVDNTYFACMQKLAYINANHQIKSFFINNRSDDLLDYFVFNDMVRSLVDSLLADMNDLQISMYANGNFLYNCDYVFKLEVLDTRLGDAALLAQIKALEGDQTLWHFDGARDALYVYRMMLPETKNLVITEMTVPFRRIENMFTEPLPQGSALLYRLGGTERLIAGTADGQSGRLVPIESRSGYDDESALLLLPGNVVYRDANMYALVLLLVFVSLAFTIYFTTGAASRQLTKNVSKLIEAMNANIHTANYSEALQAVDTNDDIGGIEAKVYGLLGKVQQYYEQINQIEADKSALELELLQSHMNPHFLYNTLSTMRWSCNSPQLESVIDAMVAYYRMALNMGNSILTIGQEIEMLTQYLQIQQFTYSLDLRYTIEIDDDIKKCRILKNLLQTIVENAVLHGINGREDAGGTIKITGRAADGVIRIEIADDGVGMSAGRVREIEEGTVKNKLGGYGLRNTQKRIALYYGESYGISVQSEIGVGTVVSVVIPMVMEP